MCDSFKTQKADGADVLLLIIQEQWCQSGKTNRFFLTLLLASALISPPFFFFLRWSIHLHIYVQNASPELLLQFLPDTHVISLRYC